MKKHGKLDYVASWYQKSADYIQGTNTKVAFVSTNSITQGESVGILWRHLFAEKKIEIQSILKKNIWILSVKNSCVQDVVIRENRIETTKEEKESHGFGISNIERVAKKYGGNLKLSCENRVFTARATLMLMV